MKANELKVGYSLYDNDDTIIITKIVNKTITFGRIYQERITVIQSLDKKHWDNVGYSWTDMLLFSKEKIIINLFTLFNCKD